MTILDFHKISGPYCDPDRIQTGLADDNAGILLENVVKSFGGKPVLKGIDLSIRQHEFVAILGKSGCGKSTLLRILGGLEQSDSGRISKAGKPYQPEETRLMFQEPRLLPWFNLADNVTLALSGHGNKQKARKMACDILQKVGLHDRINDWPASLSGGQRQRVALARALISRPQILALDEPLGALDALTRLDMQRLLERIWSESQFAAVLVTHDVGEAALLADRILIMKEGVITQNITVDLPRPRKPGCRTLSELEKNLLDHLLAGEADNLPTYA